MLNGSGNMFFKKSEVESKQVLIPILVKIIFLDLM